MLVLAEKGLWNGLPNKMISFSNKEHKSDEVMKLNPRGQVPTFKDGDTIVNESGAICFYIEEKYSNADNRLLPVDAGQRALVYQRMFESSNIQSNVMQPLFYYKMTTKKEDWDENYLKEKREAAETEIARWNGYLEAKDFLVGDKFSMADVFFYPFVAFLVRLGAKFEKNANLQRYYDNLTKRASVQESWPPHWKEGAGPDFMADLKV
jgi:glutathione S-transferase